MATSLLSGGERLAWGAAFHSQQCVEKAIKAYLVWRQIEYPFIHHIEKLLDICGEPLKSSAALTAAIALTPYAVGSRYLGANPTVEEATSAVSKAAEAIAAVKRQLISEGAKV